jgi:3-methyl-2-oxobutanoate hydroxymethyltransferase
MAGLRRGRMQRFVKQYTNLAKIIGDAATEYVDEVRMGIFPANSTPSLRRFLALRLSNEDRE